MMDDPGGKPAGAPGACLECAGVLAALGALLAWHFLSVPAPWQEDVYSLALASQTPASILEHAAADFRSPGYFFALKAWLRLGRIVMGEPGLRWAMLPGAVAWLLLAAGSWSAGKRLLGGRFGVLAAIAVAGSPLLTRAALELSGYSLAGPCVGCCFLIQAVLLFAGPTPRQGRALETLYAVVGTAALWLSLSSAAPLLALAAWRLVRRDSKRMRSAVSVSLPFVLFGPWLWTLGRQILVLGAKPWAMLTPPSLFNAAAFFLHWLPFGRLENPAWPGALRTMAPGGMALLVLSLAAVRVGWRGATFRLAVFGLGIAAFTGAAFWLPARLGLLPTFQGPVHGGMAAAMCCFGLCAVCAACARTAGWRAPTGWLLMLPWLACSAAGQLILHRQVSEPAIEAWTASHGECFRTADRRLYVLAPELVPYFRGGFAGFHVERIEDLREARGSSVAVLGLNPWRAISRPRDAAARAALESGLLAESSRMEYLPEKEDHRAQVWRLDGFRPDAAARIFAEGVAPRRPPVPAEAVSSAAPGFQRRNQGWSDLEVTPAMEAYRWATCRRAAAHFDQAVPPGDYTLHFAGYRSQFPDDPAEMTFRFEGEESDFTMAQGSGSFHLERQVRLESGRRPVLWVSHPVWTPAEYEDDSKDRRPLAFLFNAAWLEPAGATGARQP
ncbi:hypothetical protein HZA57_06535 [Candidatus Poribacteria bacterium]|nr:hypothetical protein [Candidatus Poribacteria bacterium]